MIKSIIFDLNGVLIDSNSFNANLFREIFGRYSKEAGEKAAYHYLHNGGIPRKARMELYLREFAGVEPTSEEVNKVLNEFSELLEKRLTEIPLNHNVKELLEERHRECLFFVSSGALVKDAEKILRAKGILKYFEKVYGSPQKKDKHILDILSSYNLEKGEVIFVGDSIHDKDAADITGVNFIGKITEENSWEGVDIPKIVDLGELFEIDCER
jgi:phosphoglycolate phosphatase-like HAD superfamily hydrolase